MNAQIDLFCRTHRRYKPWKILRYLTEAPSVAKLVTQDGLVLDRSEVLFYPDFDEDGVTITFYNGKKTKYYRYEELAECTVVGEDGRKFCNAVTAFTVFVCFPIIISKFLISL